MRYLTTDQTKSLWEHHGENYEILLKNVTQINGGIYYAHGLKQYHKDANCSVNKYKFNTISIKIQ